MDYRRVEIRETENGYMVSTPADEGMETGPAYGFLTCGNKLIHVFNEPDDLFAFLEDYFTESDDE